MCIRDSPQLGSRRSRSRDHCLISKTPSVRDSARSASVCPSRYSVANRDRRNNNSGCLAAKSFAHDHSINPPPGTITNHQPRLICSVRLPVLPGRSGGRHASKPETTLRKKSATLVPAADGTTTAKLLEGPHAKRCWYWGCLLYTSRCV